MKKPAKEKKYYGAIDFTENTMKWGKILLISLAALMVIALLSRFYDTYQAQQCAEEGCATTEAQEIEKIQERTELEATPTGEKITIGDLEYKLYKVPNTELFILVGWETLEDKGTTIRETVLGVEEKEIIKTSENEGIFVWGALGTELKVSQNGIVLGEYAKALNETKLIKIPVKTTTDVLFQ